MNGNIKKTGIVLFLAHLLFLHTYAQQKEILDFDKRIIYELSYQTDSNDKFSTKQMYLELLINNDGSLFRAVEKGRRDSVFYSDSKSKIAAVALRPVYKFDYEIFKRGNSITTFDSPFGMSLNEREEVYYYRENKNVFEWGISDDTLMIGNLLCQRANLEFGGRSWIAWFAAEIPIQDGPYKFCGLPGLIISIYDTSESWRFDLTNIQNVNKTVVVNFQPWYKFTKSTKEDLYRERRNYQNNLFSTVEAAGSRFDHPTDKSKTHEWFRSNIAKHMADDNNWIELDR